MVDNVLCIDRPTEGRSREKITDQAGIHSTGTHSIAGALGFM
jgi:hypothetical protein